MIFQQLNPASCRTYLLGDESSRQAALVDPVLEHVGEYLRLIDQRGLTLTQVIDTHTHADHISGAAALKDLVGCDYAMHADAPARCVTMRLTDGVTCHLGDISMKVMSTPGHTSDSIALILPDRLLTGDVLFLDEAGGGRTDLPGGDPGSHWDSLQRILGLPDRLIVYPAHEYRHRRPSSLREQKQRNPALQPRSKQEYVDYLGALNLGPADWMKDVLKANYACARDPNAAWIPVDVPACEVKGTLTHGVNDQRVDGLSVAELAELIQAQKPVVLLDVRTPEEIQGPLGHLPGVFNIPVEELPRRISELDAKDRPLVTICKSGGRAHTAAQILIQSGFRNVRMLMGGMTAWRQQEGDHGRAGI